jgi:Fe-S cluster assembly ATP-binding protein
MQNKEGVYSRMGADLAIQNLHVCVEGQEILRGLDFQMNRGEIHAIMGPNGSGKSTLANTLMGHPAYKVTEGQILFKGQNLVGMSPDQRSRLGLFLAFQYPSAIPGVSVSSFLRTAINARRASGAPASNGSGGTSAVSLREFRSQLKEKMAWLQMDSSFARRYLNEGFSGGEKKRMEILQMAMLEPEIAVLDETDSGLDIDALRIVSEGVNRLLNPGLGVLVITHYQRILNYIQPQHVHILVAGRIVMSGGPELALELEDRGYDWVKGELAQS